MVGKQPGYLLLLSTFKPKQADQSVNNNMVSIALLTSPELPTFYTSSDLKEEIEVAPSFAPSGMYFIPQKDNRTGALLLSRSQSLKNNQEDAIGWVDPESVFEWRDRRCAEPNWTLKAVEARREAGWRAMVFENPWAARSYMNQDTIGAVLWDKDLFRSALQPSHHPVDPGPGPERRPAGSIRTPQKQNRPRLLHPVALPPTNSLGCRPLSSPRPSSSKNVNWKNSSPT